MVNLATADEDVKCMTEWLAQSRVLPGLGGQPLVLLSDFTRTKH